MKPFTDTLRQINRGALVDELSQSLAALVIACRTTSRPGELTLKLKLKPDRGGAYLTVEAEHKCKTPEFVRPTAVFFANGQGDLLLNDPNQPELPFREVLDTATGEIRSVA